MTDILTLHIPAHISIRGFLTISDGIAGRTGNWIEEVPTIATIQFISNHQEESQVPAAENTFGPFVADHSRVKAKLVQISGLRWDVDFSSSLERRERHRRKMMTKKERANNQMKLLGIPKGKVVHILPCSN